MSDENLLLFRLGDFDINGVICSTNDQIWDSPNRNMALECNTVVAGNDQFNGMLYSNIAVTCPPGCL